MSVKNQRFAAVVGVKLEHVARYRELHAAVWPDVLALISQSRLRNYSIYLRHLPDGKPYLFSYFEYDGTDLAGDMAQMIANPVMQRWWAECVPLLELLPDRAPGEVWSPLEEVFHLD